MGEQLGKPEYDRDPYPPRSSSDSYYPNGDTLGAYGGGPPGYHPGPGYPTNHYDSWGLPPGRGMPGPPPPQSSSFSSMPPPRLGSPMRQGGGLFPSIRRPSMDTVIVWDWDDTLMCSTAINSGRQVSPQLEGLIEEALTFSISLGETMVVTNADDMWVFESSRRFAPRVRPLLHQIAVHSARRKFESKFPGDVFAWKRECFREILAARPNNGQGLNLVALGDSPAEMEAAQTCTYGLPIHPVIVKTVKFKETPTSDELCEQLRLCMQDLRGIVEDEKDSSRNLAMWMRQPSSPGFGGVDRTYSPKYMQEMTPLSPGPPSFHSPPLGSSNSLEGSYKFGTPSPYHQPGNGVYLTSF